MRMFIAACLPKTMLDALAETSALLRDTIRGRYAAIDSLHVTLAFLGDVRAASIPDLQLVLDDACGDSPQFEVALGELGSFGKSTRATLWQGFDDDGRFGSLAHDIRGALTSEGFTFDNRGFRAHVTLMRNADLSSGVLPAPVIERGVVDTVTLFQSDLSGDRPCYSPLHGVLLPPRGAFER